MNWTDIFSPMVDTFNLSVRTQQAQLGDEVIRAFSGTQPLIAEAGTGTGKSLAALIPMIECIREGKKKKIDRRGVVSTETNTLLDQYVLKDLPTLLKVYPGFKYAPLKGRSNYVCMNCFTANSFNNQELLRVLRLMHKNMNSLGDGERPDVEKFLRSKHIDVDDHLWSRMHGDAKRCNDFRCDATECFSARARQKALQSDIVITNHSIVRVDADTRSEGVDGFLGPVDYLVIDEAHTLEDVLISGWTDEYTEWEINETALRIMSGAKIANCGEISANVIELVQSYLEAFIHFYYLRTPEGQEWADSEETLRQVYVDTSGDAELKQAMEQHEEIGPARLDTALEQLSQLADRLSATLKSSDHLTKKEMREVQKAYTASAKIADLCVTMRAAAETTDGIIMNYGVPTVVTLAGRLRRDGTPTGKVSIVPLDISKQATEIWKGRKHVLMSATLQDLAQGGFNYLRASLGVGASRELTVESPFKYAEAQRTYLTPGYRPIDLRNAQFNFEELVEVITASKGRSLVLFTARKELEYAYEKLKTMKLPFKLLVQDGITQKRDLTKQFTEDTHSTLLALKSFFTGNDFQGETLSQVVLVKYPLPRWDSVTRARSKWWGTRGFSKWYDEQAMNVFRQAAGRLIRSDDCRGVVTVLDRRVANPQEKVYNICMSSVTALGSPVLRSVSEIGEFIDG